MLESDSASSSSPSRPARTAVTVAAGVRGSARSQESSWRARTSAIAPASASPRAGGGSAVIAARNAVPRVRAYQATPCRHPVSAPYGVVVQPSSSTAAPGAAAAKSSLGQPGVPGSVASAMRIRRCSSDEPGLDRFFPVTAAGGGIDPPRVFPGPDADRLVQGGAPVVQAGAVLGGVPAAQDSLGDQRPVPLPAGLTREIFMHAVTVGDQPQPAGERAETITERVGGAAGVPAQAARAGPGQDHPGGPAAAQDPRQAVGPPHGHQVNHV